MNFTVTQTYNVDAKDPVEAARDAEWAKNLVYRVEDDLGRLYEVDLNSDSPEAIPLPPF